MKRSTLFATCALCTVFFATTNGTVVSALSQTLAHNNNNAVAAAAARVRTAPPEPAESVASYLSFGAKESYLLLKADTSFVVLDVRTPWEYQHSIGRLPKAMFIAVDELEARIGELTTVKNRPIMVYCHSGARSKRACELLAKQGFLPYNMEGGIKAWSTERYPILRMPVAKTQNVLVKK